MAFETTNVAATVGQGSNLFNPMQTVQSVAATQNLLNQNRFFQAQRAQGAAVQGAINPFTGEYDPAAANAAIAGNPNAAMGAQDVVNANLGYQANATALAQKQLDYARSTIGAVASSRNANSQAVEGVVDAMVASKAIPAVMGSYIKSSIPTDPSQFGAWAQNNFQFPALGAQGAMDATHPKPVAINTGGQTNLVTTPNYGSPTLAGTLQNTMTPIENATTRTVVQNGKPISVPFSTLYNFDGTPKPNAFTGAQGQAQAAYTPTEQATGTALGGTLGTGAGNQVNDLLQSAAGSAQRKTLLSEMRDIISKGDFRTGPNAGKWANLVTNLNSTFGTNFDTSGAAAEQVFSKIAEQFAAQQQKAVGRAGTDAQTAATRLANPNTQFSPEANQQVIGQLLGNEDLIQHETKAYKYWLNRGGSPQDFGTSFAPSYTSRFNPLFFQEGYMTPLQRKTVIGGMSAADAKAYQAAKARYMALDFNQ